MLSGDSIDKTITALLGGHCHFLLSYARITITKKIEIDQDEKGKPKRTLSKEKECN